jgi:hypothetical protein
MRENRFLPGVLDEVASDLLLARLRQSGVEMGVSEEIHTAMADVKKRKRERSKKRWEGERSAPSPTGPSGGAFLRAGGRPSLGPDPTAGLAVSAT